MRSEPVQTGLGLTTLVRACAMVASVVVTFICLRLPIPIFGKIVLILFAYLLLRWFVSIPRKMESDSLFQHGRQLERNGDSDAAVRSYEQALVRSPNDTSIALRLLANYNRALQVNKAKDLIQRLNGREFHENEVEELEAIVTQYRRAEFTKRNHKQVLHLLD